MPGALCACAGIAWLWFVTCRSLPVICPLLRRMCCAIVLVCGPTSGLAAEHRPNVLLLLVDDLKPSFGAYGETWVHSPNLDRLAARSVTFDRAYCNQAVCAPSRNNLLVGSRSTSTGIYSLGFHFRRALPDAVTLPQFFMQHGYHSAGVGKVFHIGHGNINDKRSWSVPFQPDKVIDYVLPESTGGQLTREEALFSNKPAQGLPRGAAWEKADVTDDAYADGRIAAEGVRRLRKFSTSRTPFFLALGFTKPHLPFCAPKKYWDLYDRGQLPLPAVTQPPQGAPAYAGKTLGELNQYKPVPQQPPLDEPLQRTLIHGYYAAMSYMDAQVGRVLDELDRSGLAKNTIVVLWGDHGYHLGDHGMWTKHTNYEQANRIPLMIAGPGVARPGSRSDALVETVDVFPTLAELAGLPAPNGPQPMDGISLAGLLRGDVDRVRDHAYHCYPRGRRLGRAVRTARHRLVEWKVLGQPDAVPEYELYDYEADPLETENLAAQQPALVRQLAGVLAAHPPAKARAVDVADNGAATEAAQEGPVIARRNLVISAEATAESPNGVVVAQGGRVNGVALHFVAGRPVFDVRVNGRVVRLSGLPPAGHRFRLTATLTEKEMTLVTDDRPAVRGPSPGLIPEQPADGLSVGKDTRTAAGDYQAPNAFNGRVVSARVTPTTP